MSKSFERDLIYFAGDADTRIAAFARLRDLGWRLLPVRSVRAALRLLHEQHAQRFAGLLDVRGGLDERTLASLGPVLSASNVGWVVGVTAAQLQTEPVRRLIRDYCYDYVTLPCPDAVLNTVIGHAQGLAALAAPVERAAAASGECEGMIGDSAPMRQLHQTLRKAAPTDAPIFIAGETGTGKELAASAIHRLSTRHAMPFVAINCGAIPHNLVLSELFGYERGAFTGATQRKLGRIEMAHGGTLFLDEIGDLPLDSQASLLRFLQQGSFERLGGHDPIRVDVRIVSATHHDLDVAVAEGRFRADLYHRLCVIRLRQPPLREREDDIVRLAHHALSLYAEDHARVFKGFAPCALRAILAYAWPGNVRELINRVRQAVVMAEGRYITAADLHLEAATATTPTLEDARNDAERAVIQLALQHNQNRLVDAARELGISRVTLYRLMVRHGLRGTDPADDTVRVA